MSRSFCIRKFYEIFRAGHQKSSLLIAKSSINLLFYYCCQKLFVSLNHSKIWWCLLCHHNHNINFATSLYRVTTITSQSLTLWHLFLFPILTAVFIYIRTHILRYSTSTFTPSSLFHWSIFTFHSSFHTMSILKKAINFIFIMDCQ